MLFKSRRRCAEESTDNPLVAVVRPFDHGTRRALYAAANGGELRRGNWYGCALNRAAATIGLVARGHAEAAKAFNVSPKVIAEFLRSWDGLRGTDERCTALLREAILAVGLFPDEEQAPGHEPTRAAGDGDGISTLSQA
jgi:hypothetical protein